MTAHIATLATEATNLLIEAVEQIPPRSWGHPSNLEDWSIRDVVGHATGSAAKIVTLVEGGELPDDLVTFCRELVESLPEDMLRRPGGFGPAQPAPADATPTTRLMAHLGRSVDSQG